MMDDLYAGTWEGYYSYGEGYEEERRRIKVGFFIKMTLDGGILTGTCEEYVTKVLMKQPATLNGVIDGLSIRFFKVYPFYFEINEQREISVDKSKAGLTVHYSGSYDPNNKTFSGKWGIEPVPGMDEDADGAYLYSGNWTMVKA
jgi:hypothetical protein